jgi:hypothetical protein
MSRSLLRRTFAGLFALLFVVTGVTRELVGACPTHGAGSVEAHPAGVAAQPTSGHEDHAAMSHGDGGHASHVSAGATQPPVDDGSGTPSHGGHCDCLGECCGCAPIRTVPLAPLAFAALAPISTSASYDVVSAERTDERVDVALPFATAPPAHMAI